MGKIFSGSKRNTHTKACLVDATVDQILRRSSNEESDKKLQDEIVSIVEGFEGELTAEVVFGIYTIETIIDAAKH